MEIWFLPDGGPRRKVTPKEGEPCALAEGDCPLCHVMPLMLFGRNMRDGNDDRSFDADAFCIVCERQIGIVRALPSTIFGVKEDRAVLNGRCRVY